MPEVWIVQHKVVRISFKLNYFIIVLCLHAVPFSPSLSLLPSPSLIHFPVELEGFQPGASGDLGTCRSWGFGLYSEGREKSSGVGLSLSAHTSVRVDLFLSMLYIHIRCKVLYFFKFYLFLEREEGRRKRGREASMCGCLSCAPSWVPGHNPGMCPDQESNQ